MGHQQALKRAQDASDAVRALQEKIDQARLNRAKCLLDASDDGFTQQEIADACDLHLKTVQAEIRFARHTKN